MTDQEAFEKLKQGDRNAMEWVYRNKRDAFVLFFMKHYRLTIIQATDLSIDALITLMSFAQNGEDRSLTSQLLTLWIGIGKNLFHSELKSVSKLPIVNWEDFVDYLKYTEQSENPFETTEFEDVLHLVEPLMNQMLEPCLTILKHFYWGKKSDREISEYIKKTGADLKEMSESAVKMKRRRCIDELRVLVFNHLK